MHLLECVSEYSALGRGEFFVFFESVEEFFRVFF